MDEHVRQDWGRRVRDRRRALGFSQERLAELAGTDQGTISKVERGKVRISDEFKWSLAGALGEPVPVLFPFPASLPPFPTAVSA